MPDRTKVVLKFEYDFEFDAEGYDPKFVDLNGLAKDSAIRELEDEIRRGTSSLSDYLVSCACE